MQGVRQKQVDPFFWRKSLKEIRAPGLVVTSKAQIIVSERRLNTFVVVQNEYGETLWKASAGSLGLVKKKKIKRSVLRTNVLFNALMSFWVAAKFVSRVPCSLACKQGFGSLLVRKLMPFFTTKRSFRVLHIDKTVLRKGRMIQNYNLELSGFMMLHGYKKKKSGCFFYTGKPPYFKFPLMRGAVSTQKTKKARRV